MTERLTLIVVSWLVKRSWKLVVVFLLDLLREQSLEFLTIRQPKMRISFGHCETFDKKSPHWSFSWISTRYVPLSALIRINCCISFLFFETNNANRKVKENVTMFPRHGDEKGPAFPRQFFLSWSERTIDFKVSESFEFILFLHNPEIIFNFQFLVGDVLHLQSCAIMYVNAGVSIFIVTVNCPIWLLQKIQILVSPAYSNANVNWCISVTFIIDDRTSAFISSCLSSFA